MPAVCAPARPVIPVCQGADPNPRPARFVPPSGAVDTHAHVFGPAGRYAYTPNRSYTPPDAPLDAYESMLRTLGLERGVIVQPSVYGTDNRCTLDAIRQADLEMRGIAVIDESIADAALEEMQQVGIRGIRVNMLYKGGIPFETAERLAHRIRDLGWHLQLLIDVSEFEDLERRLDRLPVPAVIDHMGHMGVAKGVAHPGFQALLRLLRQGRTWVKLSGSYRITGERTPPYRDVTPVARMLIEANADRLVWATDWPHPSVDIPMPNDGALLDMLADWAPDEATRSKILVDNPSRLYGFSAPAAPESAGQRSS